MTWHRLEEKWHALARCHADQRSSSWILVTSMSLLPQRPFPQPTRLYSPQGSPSNRQCQRNLHECSVGRGTSGQIRVNLQVEYDCTSWFPMSCWQQDGNKAQKVRRRLEPCRHSKYEAFLVDFRCSCSFNTVYNNELDIRLLSAGNNKIKHNNCTTPANICSNQ